LVYAGSLSDMEVDSRQFKIIQGILGNKEKIAGETC
jgi:hypothetical protein